MLNCNELFKLLNNELALNNLECEVIFYGNNILVMAYDGRGLNRKIEQVYMGKSKLYGIIDRLTDCNNLEKGWFHTCVNSIIEKGGSSTISVKLSHFSIYKADIKYMLALKLNEAIFTGIYNKTEIHSLIGAMGYSTIEEVLEAVNSFYEVSNLPEEALVILKAYYANKVIRDPSNAARGILKGKGFSTKEYVRSKHLEKALEK